MEEGEKSFNSWRLEPRLWRFLSEEGGQETIQDSRTLRLLTGGAVVHEYLVALYL
jgi:hypothetical protein